MQEISPNVYIETSFLGVTVGALNLAHGLVLIDSPFRADDLRSWRASILSLSGGIDRILINLDAHPDRTLGVRTLECTVIGHEKMAGIFRARPLTFKAQSSESGADWELCEGLGSVRWAAPEITFTNEMTLYWDEHPLRLEYHPGCSIGAIWVNIPFERISFIGDTVTPGQPPYFGNADLSLWIEELEHLAAKAQDSLLISGRGGLITQADVRNQLQYMQMVNTQIETLFQRGAAEEETASLVPGLLKPFTIPPERGELYRRRLKWGLRHYYQRLLAPEIPDSTQEIVEP